jgi:RimJ/RimL family protein N-acetyltransferase
MHFLPQIVTISDSTKFPVRYKRVRKPTIRRLAFGIWLCVSADNPEAWGKGYSVAAAYRAWHRNHFLPERR